MDPVAKLGSHLWGLSGWLMIFLCSEIGFLEVFEKIEGSLSN